ncbi:MAG TPA: hypothetical protein VKB93_17540 [Thermoanaerobaculia bacterium]|nr:hypothetical protein [Thermoanaerobaculia bacterium]
MRLALLSLLLLLTGTTAIAETTFACNMKALSREERQRYGALAQKLAAARGGIAESASGYDFTLELDRLALRELAEWIELEARCCPFFTFHVELRGGASTAVLRLTGPKGVKAFIREEFGLS